MMNKREWEAKMRDVALARAIEVTDKLAAELERLGHVVVRGGGIQVGYGLPKQGHGIATVDGERAYFTITDMKSSEEWPQNAEPKGKLAVKLGVFGENKRYPEPKTGGFDIGLLAERVLENIKERIQAEKDQKASSDARAAREARKDAIQAKLEGMGFDRYGDSKPNLRASHPSDGSGVFVLGGLTEEQLFQVAALVKSFRQ